MTGKEKLKLTSDQQAAINWGEGDVLVAAAAGGGKTTVLVERYIQLIGRGEPADNIPVLTFTEKAAAQLKQRARARLEEIGAGRDILRALDGAYISTIHSFCRRLLRENYHLAGIDPSFVVIPEEEARRLKRQAIDEIFEDIFNTGFGGPEMGENVRDLCTAHGGNDFEQGIGKQILAYHDWLMKQVSPEDTLNSVIEASDQDPSESPELWRYIHTIAGLLLTLRDEVKKLEPWRDDRKKDGELYSYASNIQGSILRLDEILSIDPDKSSAKLLKLASEWKMPAMHGKSPDELKKVHGAIKSGVYDEISQLIIDGYDVLIAESAVSRRRLRTLSGLTALFMNRYTMLKTRRWGMDFDDLQHNLMRLLRAHPEVGEGYRQRFKYLLIDEFQDNNRLQEAIIREVCASGGLFMVGDSKQAVYRFRGADPDVFLENERRNLDLGEGNILRLNMNFRSLPAICLSVNSLIGPLFSGGSAEIDYSKGHALEAGRDTHPDGDPVVEFHIIGREEDASSSEDEEFFDDRDSLQVEADWLALRVKTLVESGEITLQDKDGTTHQAGYGDIAVLLRSVSKRAPIFAASLRKLGVPHRQISSGGFLEAQEIRDLRNLLRVVDNTLQDIPLAAVLRSPLCGIDADALYRISKVVVKDNALYSKCGKVDDAGLGEGTRGLLSSFLARINRWREMEPYITPAELILDILQYTAYRDYVTGLESGRVARANLERLVDIAATAIPPGEGGLRKFIVYLDDMEAGDYNFKPGEVSSNEGAVTIMTVHSAKGLEFPVVFIPDLGKEFNEQDTRGEVIFDDDTGPCYKYVDTSLGYARPTFDYLLSRRRMKAHGRAEELRVYYVALTRARDKLICSGSADLERIQKIIDRDGGTLTSANTPLEWFIPVLGNMGGAEGVVSQASEAKSEISCECTGDNGCGVKLTITPRDGIQSVTPGPQPDQGLKSLIAKYEDIGVKADIEKASIHHLLKEYPFQRIVSLHDKITAGRIEHSYWLSEHDDTLDYTPVKWDTEFSGASEDARREGTMLHSAFEEINFQGVGETGWVEREAARLVAEMPLPEGWESSRLAASLKAFLEPPLAGALSDPTHLLKEQAFSLKMHLKDLPLEISTQPEAKDWIMLQGRMDLVIVKGDSAYLVDYKSDSVSEGGIHERAERYVPQLAAYAEALRRLIKTDIHCLIYFIRHGKALDVSSEVNSFALGESVLKACESKPRTCTLNTWYTIV